MSVGVSRGPVRFTFRWRPTPGERLIWGALRVLATIAVVVTLWPSRLGGWADFIVVRGNSMQPTLFTGDLVITRSLGGYNVGDIVLYTVPKGQPGAGHRVVHRIVGRRLDGRYVMRGDNSKNPDVWEPTAGDIRGETLLLIPKVGGFLLGAAVPLAFALMAGAAVMKAFWPARPAARDRRADDRSPIPLTESGPD